MSVKEQELYVAINTLTFCLHDEDGNEVLNKDGTIKEFYFKGRLKPLEYLCEDMTLADLEEVSDE